VPVAAAFDVVPVGTEQLVKGTSKVPVHQQSAQRHLPLTVAPLEAVQIAAPLRHPPSCHPACERTSGRSFPRGRYLP